MNKWQPQLWLQGRPRQCGLNLVSFDLTLPHRINSSNGLRRILSCSLVSGFSGSELRPRVHYFPQQFSDWYRAWPGMESSGLKQSRWTSHILGFRPIYPVEGVALPVPRGSRVSSTCARASALRSEKRLCAALWRRVGLLSYSRCC